MENLIFQKLQDRTQMSDLRISAAMKDEIVKVANTIMNGIRWRCTVIDMDFQNAHVVDVIRAQERVHRLSSGKVKPVMPEPINGTPTSEQLSQWHSYYEQERAHRRYYHATVNYRRQCLAYKALLRSYSEIVDPDPANTFLIIPSKSEQSQPLPNGWERRFTDAGRPYYINHTLRISQWKRPVDEPGL